MVSEGNDPQMAQQFRLVKYDQIYPEYPPPLTLEYLGGVRQEISEKYFT